MIYDFGTPLGLYLTQMIYLLNLKIMIMKSYEWNDLIFDLMNR